VDPQRRTAAGDDGDWSAAFQKQRRRNWRNSRWALLVLLVTFAAAWWDMRGKLGVAKNCASDVPAGTASPSA
jgi:hypothetical protein